MSSVTKDTLMRVLPSVLDNDPGMHSLGETTAEALARLWSNIDLPQIYTRVDELPEELLDILAHDFKLDWYDVNYPLKIKRALFRDSFYVHKHLGTRKAVQQVIDDVYGSGSIQEWFEYGGTPYHFRVYTTNTSVLQENYDAFMRILNIVKNVRSVLDGIIYSGATGNARMAIGTKVTGVQSQHRALARNYDRN